MVSLDGRVKTGRDKGGRVSEKVDVFVDLLDDLERQLGDERPIGNQEDRDLLVTVTDPAENVERGTLIELDSPFEVPVEEDRGVLGSDVTRESPSSGEEVRTTS